MAINKPHSNLTIENVGVQSTIYLIKLSGRPSYVGQTNNFDRRCKEHKNSLTKGTHKNLKLQKRYLTTYPAEIEIVPILELPTDNKQIIYFAESLAISYFQYDVVNNPVICERGANVKLPYVQQDIAEILLKDIADFYNTTLNL